MQFILTATTILLLASCASQPSSPAQAKYQSRDDFAREWCARNNVNHVPEETVAENKFFEGFADTIAFPFRVGVAAAEVAACVIVPLGGAVGGIPGGGVSCGR